MRTTQSAQDFDTAVREVLLAARRMLRAEFAELVLLPGSASEQAVRSRISATEESMMQTTDLTPAERIAMAVVASNEGDATAAASTCGTNLARRRTGASAFLNRPPFPVMSKATSKPAIVTGVPIAVAATASRRRDTPALRTKSLARSRYVYACGTNRATIRS